jgi:hypothetical protein
METSPNPKDAQSVQLAPGALTLFEQSSLRYDAEIAPGVDPAELLKPAFWAHHAVRLRPWNEIRARAADGTWMANYVVLDCSRTWARVHQLDFHRLTTGEVAETQASEQEVRAYIEQHRITFRGPQKWSIVRKTGNAVVEEGIVDKLEAEKKLETLARSHVGGAGATPKPVTA